jgi:hypothetical protein
MSLNPRPDLNTDARPRAVAVLSTLHIPSSSNPAAGLELRAPRVWSEASLAWLRSLIRPNCRTDYVFVY